jgi:hypothetical protein
VVNRAASSPLAGLSGTNFMSYTSGAVFPLTPTVEGTVLDSFLYQTAYIGALIATGNYNPYKKYTWMPKSGAVEDAAYGSLNKDGIGLNKTFYIEFSGIPSGFNTPAAYTFKRPDGYVFGRYIDVECANATAS